MKIAWVLEATTVAGGHRTVLTFANYLQDRGHEVCVFCVYPSSVAWAGCRVPVIETGSYEGLERALRAYDGIKIATWWRTAPVVSRTGGGFYFVQDIETSYSSDPVYRREVLATYCDPALIRFTYGRWIQQEMASLGYGWMGRTGIAVEHDTFYAEPRSEPQVKELLFHQRDHPLKGPELRDQVLAEMPRLGIRTVSYSPWGGNRLATEHLAAPTDQQLAARMRNAFCFLVTSRHEGFCLPALEAMACGLPLVTTPADGNEEFCIDGVNCLMGQTADDLIEAVKRLQGDNDLWKKIRAGGIAMAQLYQWEECTRRLEAVLDIQPLSG